MKNDGASFKSKNYQRIMRTRRVLGYFRRYHRYQDGPQGSETELPVLTMWPL